MFDPTAQPQADPVSVARHVRRMAAADAPPWLHEEAARRMAERLAPIRQPAAEWLHWGGRLGGGAAAVAAVWPQARCVAVVETQSLPARAAASRSWWQRWRTAGDAPNPWRPDEVPAACADMVWANMAWHHGMPTSEMMSAWHRALRIGGLLMFSSYGPASFRELRALHALRGWDAPHAPWMDMHDLGDALVQAGFAEPVMDQETLTLHWSGPQALMAELRSLGGNTAAPRRAGLRTPRWREAWLEDLASLADAQGRIAMTVELVYGHAWRGQPRADAEGITRIEADSLRRQLRDRRRA